MTEPTVIHRESDTWRVYIKEWVYEFQSELPVREGDVYPEKAEAECQKYFDLVYAGRVDEWDWEIIPMSYSSIDERRTLRLRLWNYPGEWKHRADAETHADSLRRDHPEVRVVRRNSKDEHLLRDYGKVLLSIAQSKGQTVGA